MMSSRDNIWIELTDEPIQISAYQEKVADPDVGAHGWFLGVTRRTTSRANANEGDAKTRVTVSLSYEAHHQMAHKELLTLAEQAITRFGLAKIVIIHRLGEVPVGEASVVVGCSSPHRPATFDALAWVMDTLKRNVPIWKRERYADETTEWIHPGADVESDGSE